MNVKFFRMKAGKKLDQLWLGDKENCVTEISEAQKKSNLAKLLGNIRINSAKSNDRQAFTAFLESSPTKETGAISDGSNRDNSIDGTDGFSLAQRISDANIVSRNKIKSNTLLFKEASVI